MKRIPALLTGLVTGLALLLSGCGLTQTVAPFERGNLAAEEMAWNPDTVGANYRDHMHNSKAATPAAATVGGGGCGCN